MRHPDFNFPFTPSGYVVADREYFYNFLLIVRYDGTGYSDPQFQSGDWVHRYSRKQHREFDKHIANSIDHITSNHGPLLVELHARAPAFQPMTANLAYHWFGLKKLKMFGPSLPFLSI